MSVIKLPNNLAIYLSNRCNLACRYCYVAVNQSEPEYLNAPAVKKALEEFLSLPHDARTELKVSFLGGEPLLQFDVLEDLIQHIRGRAGSSLLIHVFTNGTLLTPERADFLLEHNVEVTISLDGKKETNDRQRPFHGDAPRSVFEEALKRLAGLPLDRMGVNLVFTRQSVGALLGNIHFFYEMGFSKISFTPDLYEPWPAEELDGLSLVMDRFGRYYRLLVSRGARLFAISNLYALLEKAQAAPEGEAYWWRDCHNLVLGADGRFYNCDKPLGFTFDQITGHQAGSVETGVDWVKRDEDFAEAAAYIRGDKKLDQDYYSCPMGVYFSSRIQGKEPAPAILNFQKVSSIYSKSLLDLHESLKDNPRFLEVHGLQRERAPVAVLA